MARWYVVLARTMLVAAAVTSAAAAHAEPLNQRIPNLFGGVFITSISPNGGPDVQKGVVAERFSNLSASLAAARSQLPVPSASGAFSFKWDPELDTFVRAPQSLGPVLAERAQTLGRGTWSFGTSYTHIHFDSLDGDNLGNLRSSQQALSDAFIARLPPDDQKVKASTLNTQLNFGFSLDLMFLSAGYGVTDDLDLSMALSLSHVSMSGSALASITNPFIHDPTHPVAAYFTLQQKGAITNGTGAQCGTPYTCAADSFRGSSTGIGDLYLRSKWHFLDTEYADLAAAAVVTIPTGGANNYLGFDGPTFTPWLIASKTFGRLSPHLNLGYALRNSQDVSQAQWVAGTDVRTFDWLTLAVDFLGYHDDHRDGINDNIIQSAVGFKMNPFGQFVIGGNLQFPLNNDGLRADVIYSGLIEYTF